MSSSETPGTAIGFPDHFAARQAALKAELAQEPRRTHLLEMFRGVQEGMLERRSFIRIAHSLGVGELTEGRVSWDCDLVSRGFTDWGYAFTTFLDEECERMVMESKTVRGTLLPVASTGDTILWQFHCDCTNSAITSSCSRANYVCHKCGVEGIRPTPEDDTSSPPSSIRHSRMSVYALVLKKQNEIDDAFRRINQIQEERTVLGVELRGLMREYTDLVDPPKPKDEP